MYPYRNLSLDDMEGEVWKPIEWTNGNYSISNMGRVKSHKRKYKCCFVLVNEIHEMILRQTINRDGYLMVGLCVNGKPYTRKIQGLVARAFICNPENKKTTNHKFGDKLDNRAESLEWFTYREQEIHSYHVLGKINSKKMRAQWDSVKKKIYKYTLNGILVGQYNCAQDIQDEDLNFNTRRIKDCCNGICKFYKWYVWSYKELPLEYFESQNLEEKECGNKNQVVKLDMFGNYLFTYFSALEAERDTGVSNVTIQLTCKGKQSQSGGYRWMFRSDYKKLQEDYPHLRGTRRNKKLDSQGEVTEALGYGLPHK